MDRQFKTAASSVKLLEVDDFTNEHIKWLQEELKKPDNFIWDEGRQVMVNTQDGVDVIEIPPKENITSFVDAWLKVYNTCLATMVEDVRRICLNRKHVRKQYDQIIVGTSAPVKLPEDTKSVKYIMALEQIIENYKDLLKDIIKSSNLKSTPIKVEKHEVTLKPVEPVEIETIPEEKEQTEEKLKITESGEVREVLKGLKIPDGEKITKVDCSNLREGNNPFVLVTCTHLDKDENIFLSNAELCIEEGLSIGAYFNGKAKNPDGAVKDSKKILKLLNGLNITGPIIYEMNSDYLKTHDSSEEIYEMIQAYNGVAGILTESGYHVLVATDPDTGVLLSRQIKRDNIPCVYPMIYRIVPREMEEIADNVSYVLMDPQYDNDVVKIVNPNFEIEEKKQLQAAA